MTDTFLDSLVNALSPLAASHTAGFSPSLVTNLSASTSQKTTLKDQPFVTQNDALFASTTTSSTRQ